MSRLRVSASPGQETDCSCIDELRLAYQALPGRLAGQSGDAATTMAKATQARRNVLLYRLQTLSPSWNAAGSLWVGGRCLDKLRNQPCIFRKNNHGSRQPGFGPSYLSFGKNDRPTGRRSTDQPESGRRQKALPVVAHRRPEVGQQGLVLRPHRDYLTGNGGGFGALSFLHRKEHIRPLSFKTQEMLGWPFTNATTRRLSFMLRFGLFCGW